MRFRQSSGAGGVDGADSRPPNVVFLFADDLGYGDLASYGHPYISTPNLDAMAAEGQRWTDFYVAAPVCSPSRGALLTGMYPNRSGLYGRRLNVLFPGDPYGLPAETVTMAEVLNEAGYRTAIVGKWHLGDAAGALPTRHGFDYWYGLPYSNDMDWARGPDFDGILEMMAAGRGAEVQAEFAARRALYFDPRIEYWQVPLMRSRISPDGPVDDVLERPTVQQTLTRRATEEAVRFITESGDRPFFLYVPYSMPHTPIFRSEPFAGVSAGGRYGDVVEELDWSIGRIRAALTSQGVARDTLVVFTSDNGPWLAMRHHGGSPGLLNNGKGTTFAYYRGGELQAYRLGRYKLTLVSAGAYDLPPERLEHDPPLLFDLRADPGERYDIAADHPEVVADIRAAIAAHRAGLTDAPPLFDRRLAPPGGGR